MIVLPTWCHNWDCWVGYFGNLGRRFGHVVRYRESLNGRVNGQFEAEIDGRLVLVDYWDDKAVAAGTEVWKFHAQPGQAVRPFTPISFYDWEQFRLLRKQIEYKAVMDGPILCRQQIYGNAVARRTAHQSQLRRDYGDRVLLGRIEQSRFWGEVSSCWIAHLEPGYRPDILDRAMLQLMALGCCVVSPRISDLVAGGIGLVPGVHYLERIGDEPRERLIAIGRAAAAWFEALPF